MTNEMKKNLGNYPLTTSITSILEWLNRRNYETVFYLLRR